MTASRKVLRLSVLRAFALNYVTGKSVCNWRLAFAFSGSLVGLISSFPHGIAIIRGCNYCQASPRLGMVLEQVA